MATLNTIIEEEKREFDERFGNLLDPDTDRWLCQYNEHLGYSDHHLEVRDFLTSAMQRAYEAGVEDSKFHVEDNCDWFNKNNPIPDEEFHKNFEHSEMLRGVVKATCDELKAKTLTHLDQLKKEIKEKTPCNTNKK